MGWRISRGCLRFNPNLNCLVGGKGTAKSTVIETIRFAFNIPIESKDVSEQAEALLNEVFPSSAKLSLLVEVTEPRPTRYIVERTGRDRPLVRSAESGDLVEGLEPTALLRPIIFGQKEIYETALRTESQLKLLDGFCAEELRPLAARERELVADISTKSEEIRRVKGTLARDADRASELPALRERKRLFDEAGLAEKLSEQSQLERERQLFTTAEERITKHEAVLADVRSQLDEIATLTVPPEMPNADLMGVLPETLEDLGRAWHAATSALDEAVVSAHKRLNDLRREWQERFDAKRAEFDAAVREVAGEHGESEIRTYLGLDARIDELAELEKQVKLRRVNLADATRARKERVANLREVRRRIFAVRNNWAGKLTAQLEGMVKINVEHQGDRRGALAELRKLKSGAIQKQLEQLVVRPDFSPANLAELAREGAEALTKGLGVADGMAQQLARVLDDARIDALETVALEDRVEIALNLGSEFRPLDRLSAGQRSTAILLLALLESDGPLILDQPEDDLDNTFVYQDVVRRLRRAKERRQFLIATHNANIPVLGDAEQILVFDADADANVIRAQVAARGSIDDAEIHGPLEDVLEGGREAFERRKEKYGF